MYLTVSLCKIRILSVALRPTRLMLKAKELGDAQKGPRLLIVGGVHGDEYEPIAAVLRLAETLGSEEIQGAITLIPIVNEESYHLGRRTAEDNLDLARTCPGKATGSITEQVAAALSTEIAKADYFIDLHSGGKVLDIFPMAGYMLHPNPAVLDMQRAMARAFNLPLVWGTDHRLDGRSLSVARDAEVPAIYCEFGGTGRCESKCVTAYVEGCLNVIAMLDMIDRVAPTSTMRWMVEDSNPESGHLQINHPAPIAGIFETRLTPGEPVSKRQQLGVVVDVETGEEVEVLASKTGLLLAIRSLAKVERDDCLGVVVETSDAIEVHHVE